MRISIVVAIASIALSGAARAQTPASSGARTAGYVEGVAQSAFGNVTSQSFGGEIGVRVFSGLQVFVDAGVVRDAAPASLGAAAQKVAGGIAAVAGSASFRVKLPVTFGVAGLRYAVAIPGSRIEPYVLAGGGVAQVKRDVAFTTSAGDVNQFVTLGSDLSGSQTKGMVSVGGGVAVPLWQALVVDLQYRYGRVFTDEGLNVNRAGVGIGVRF